MYRTNETKDANPALGELSLASNKNAIRTQRASAVNYNTLFLVWFQASNFTLNC